MESTEQSYPDKDLAARSTTEATLSVLVRKEDVCRPKSGGGNWDGGGDGHEVQRWRRLRKRVFGRQKRSGGKYGRGLAMIAVQHTTASQQVRMESKRGGE